MPAVIVHYISTSSLTQQTRCVDVPDDVTKEIADAKNKQIPTVWTDAADGESTRGLSATKAHFQSVGVKGDAVSAKQALDAADSLLFVVVVTELDM